MNSGSRFAATGYHRACAWATRDLPRSFRSKEFGRTPPLEGLRATLELVLAEYRLDDGLRSLVERRVAPIDRQLYGRGHGSKGRCALSRSGSSGRNRYAGPRPPKSPPFWRRQLGVQRD
jgi:hypothetical protein